MKNFQRLRVAVAALGALSLLALSSAFGRGLAPLSTIPMGLSAGACFSTTLCIPSLRLQALALQRCGGGLFMNVLLYTEPPFTSQQICR